jgi:hypothetical protein
MALETGRFGSHVPAARIHLAIPMELGSCMAIGTEHPLLVVHIGDSTVLASELRIHPTPMAESASLRFVLPEELVPFHQPEVHPTDDGAFHMTVPTGSVAGAAGLFEDLCIEDLGFFFREPPADPFHPSRGIVEGKLVGFSNVLVTGPTGGRIVRRPFH